MKEKPIIGLTMGDAAGVGPEIILKSFKNKAIKQQAEVIVIGDANILEVMADKIGIELVINRIHKVNEYIQSENVINCYDLNLLPKNLPLGTISAEAGDAAFQYIKKAVELSELDQIDAICTAPLNKRALHLGGHQYPGHTEILAKLTGAKEFSMMLSTPKLKVIHVTTHIGLVDAIEAINADRVYQVIELAHKTLNNTNHSKPKIGVCGINPHAGENGLFGYYEEEQKIMPAVKQAQEAGIHAEGPLAADTLFFLAVRGDYDVVVAMYHDQGHVPVKVLGLEHGVNITVGLPIIRTSVDHGTAYDIAGKGIADERSLLEALKEAIKLI